MNIKTIINQDFKRQVFALFFPSILAITPLMIKLKNPIDSFFITSNINMYFISWILIAISISFIIENIGSFIEVASEKILVRYKKGQFGREFTNSWDEYLKADTKKMSHNVIMYYDEILIRFKFELNSTAALITACALYFCLYGLVQINILIVIVALVLLAFQIYNIVCSILLLHKLRVDIVELCAD